MCSNVSSGERACPAARLRESSSPLPLFACCSFQCAHACVESASIYTGHTIHTHSLGEALETNACSAAIRSHRRHPLRQGQLWRHGCAHECLCIFRSAHLLQSKLRRLPAHVCRRAQGGAPIDVCNARARAERNNTTSACARALMAMNAQRTRARSVSGDTRLEEVLSL